MNIFGLSEDIQKKKTPFLFPLKELSSKQKKIFTSKAL